MGESPEYCVSEWEEIMDIFTYRGRTHRYWCLHRRKYCISCTHIGKSPGKGTGYHEPTLKHSWIPCTQMEVMGSTGYCVPALEEYLHIMNPSWKYLGYHVPSCVKVLDIKYPQYIESQMLCTIIGRIPGHYVLALEEALDMLNSHGKHFLIS